MSATSLTANDELLALAERLIREYGEVPAGAVLRCLARAVRRARAWGCPAEHLVPTVEASTRWRLAQRLSGDLAPPGPQPPSCRRSDVLAEPLPDVRTDGSPVALGGKPRAARQDGTTAVPGRTPLRGPSYPSGHDQGTGSG